MGTDRIYDPTVEEMASTFPRFNVSDVRGTRAVIKAFLEAAAAEGLDRPTDEGIEEIERTIPGPEGEPEVPNSGP